MVWCDSIQSRSARFHECTTSTPSCRYQWPWPYNAFWIGGSLCLKPFTHSLVEIFAMRAIGFELMLRNFLSLKPLDLASVIIHNHVAISMESFCSFLAPVQFLIWATSYGFDEFLLREKLGCGGCTDIKDTKAGATAYGCWTASKLDCANMILLSLSLSLSLSNPAIYVSMYVGNWICLIVVGLVPPKPPLHSRLAESFSCVIFFPIAYLDWMRTLCLCRFLDCDNCIRNKQLNFGMCSPVVQWSVGGLLVVVGYIVFPVCKCITWAMLLCAFVALPGAVITESVAKPLYSRCVGGAPPLQAIFGTHRYNQSLLSLKKKTFHHKPWGVQKISPMHGIVKWFMLLNGEP